MVPFLLFIFFIVEHASCMRIISNETALLYDELDRIDNEVRRLNDILNELAWKKIKILRRLNDISHAKDTMTPTNSPTPIPSSNPTRCPTEIPKTKRPTNTPTKRPTNRPTKPPTTAYPTLLPTHNPTLSPTLDLNPILDNIQKAKPRKNTRTKKKSSPNDKLKEDQLLNDAVSSRTVGSKVVRLYACDPTSKDWNEDTVMSMFEEKVLIRNPQNDLLIIGDQRYHDIKKLPNNTLTGGHVTDVFLTRFIDSLINRMVPNKISAGKLKEYVIKSMERLLVIDVKTDITDRILTRMHALPRTPDLAIFESYLAFHCCSLMYGVNKIPAVDFNASASYNEMLYFLQYVFEEVVDLRITHSLYQMIVSAYAQSKKVPKKYEEGLQGLRDTRLIQNAFVNFFESARWTEPSTISHIFIASVHLRKALHLLQMNVLSFSIAEIIYEWMEGKQNYQMISISDGRIASNRMIDDFLYNLGYNDSQIERYKVKPMGKGNKFVTNPFDLPPSSFENNVVKVQKYKDGTPFLFERQLLEANDVKNDLVIILAPDVLKDTDIKTGRYCMMTKFDIDCAEMMAVFMDFLQLADRKPFDEEGKKMVRSLISVIVYSLTTLDEHFFISSVFELELAKSHLKECEEFSKIIQIGYKMMNQSKKFIELKMIQIGAINDASLDVMLSFVEIVIKQLYIVNIKILEGFIQNSTFVESNSGPMKQLFVDWKALKASMKSDLMKFEKFMNGLKRHCIEGTGRQQIKAQNIKPEIIERINKLRVTKWLIGVCNILYEWRHESDGLIVFIAYDEMWQNYFDDQNLFQFLDFIGYKNVETNEEKRQLMYEY